MPRRKPKRKPWLEPYHGPSPLCLHCDKPTRKTTGEEIYPNRGDLWAKIIFVCDPCGARGGAHPNGEPLGRPANAETRDARIKLHNLRLDPIWKSVKEKFDRRQARHDVYRFLRRRMGLSAEETHTAVWTVEQCRDAWTALRGQSIETIRAELKEEDDGGSAAN